MCIVSETMFSNCKVPQFQEELVKAMMQIERTYFRLAETLNRDVLIICDRGAMDASACKFKKN